MSNIFGFVKDVLEKKSVMSERQIKFDVSIQDKNGEVYSFDALAENGFDNIKGKVIFEFKSRSIVETSIYREAKKIWRLSDYKNSTIVIVVNGYIKTDNNLMSYNRCIDYYEGNKKYYNDDLERIVVWDRSVIENWKEEFHLEYINYLGLSEDIKGKREKQEYTVPSEEYIENSRFYVKSLINMIRDDGAFAIILGAGVSIDHGAKSWDKLLESLQMKARSEGLIDDYELLSKKVGGSALTVSQACREAFGDEKHFLWEIHRNLYKQSSFSINKNSELHHITKLIKAFEKRKKFRVISYNFDDFLERYLDSDGINYCRQYITKDEYINLNGEKTFEYKRKGDLNSNFCVYHVHGLLPEVKYKKDLLGTVCLTESDYNVLYNQPYSWPIVTQMDTYRENTCLFIGCSLSDPNIRRLLELSKEENHWHYAIISKEGLSTKDLARVNVHFYRMGVRIIWVGGFDEINTIIDEISSYV